METIFQALKGTPWWVYLLFFYLVYIGVRALKPTTMHIGKIFIIPLIFLFWSVWDLIVRFQGGTDILLYILFSGIGGIAGWGLMQRFELRADHQKLLVRIPGSPFILILVLVIFAVKYFFGYIEATEGAMGSVMHSLYIIASGLITGIFVGRVLAILKKFAKAKSEKLKKS